ncbi:MAG TPA: tetratricopeptide repeat protein [bacterium]|nr:tetratricopeptide repeat protein [bacterium]
MTGPFSTSIAARFRRSVYAASLIGLLAGALAAVSGPLARAQQAGSNWRGLIPGLKAQTAQHPDPETAFRLAMVYAHEGMLIDGWHVFKQIDKMVGGQSGRPALERNIIGHSAAAVQQNPKDLLARYSLAFSSSVAGNHDVTFREFQEITRQEPGNAMNHGYLGYVYSQRKDAKNTIAQWEEAVRLDPNNSVLHYMLGSAYYQTGRSRDAAVQFNLAYRDRTLYNYITRGEEP